MESPEEKRARLIKEIFATLSEPELTYSFCFEYGKRWHFEQCVRYMEQIASSYSIPVVSKRFSQHAEGKKTTSALQLQFQTQDGRLRLHALFSKQSADSTPLSPEQMLAMTGSCHCELSDTDEARFKALRRELDRLIPQR
jgi:hypothetical protein